MKLTIKGTEKEIAAFVLEIQGRQGKTVNIELPLFLSDETKEVLEKSLEMSRLAWHKTQLSNK